MTEQDIHGINGVVRYDVDLVDRNSPAYHVGYGEGLASNSDVPQHPRAEGMTDADWASYCEGFLMGWCER